jgi:alcohol dehydrogenase, propanol-preferring
MKAMILTKPKTPLILQDIPIPTVKKKQLLIKVTACGVCRTDRHIIDNELQNPSLPLILGHQIVGIIIEVGPEVQGFQKGDRVGVPWLGSSCQNCVFCHDKKENLCDKAQYTGYTLPGGFAEYTVCYADYAFLLPSSLSDTQIAPLLCGGLIGYRAYRKACAKKTLGFYGFGTAAHMIIQLAIYEKISVYAFTKKGDKITQDFAKNLGAIWASDSSSLPPKKLDAVIIFASDGSLVPQSLKVLKKGGKCICAAICMSDIPSFAYQDLWGEKAIESVANLTRNDAVEFLQIAPKIPITTTVTSYPLEKANQAIEDIRHKRIKGACVLTM